MSSPLSLIRHILVVLLLGCAFGLPASAQIRMENFHYDSLFHISGHAMRLPRLGHDSLRMDIFFLYHEDIPAVRQLLLGNYPSDPNPWVYKTAFRNAQYFREIDTLGLGVIMGLDQYMALYQRARVTDNYLDTVNLNVQHYEFGIDNRALGVMEPVMWDQMKALTIPRDTSAGELMMVDAARYVSFHAAGYGRSNEYTKYSLDQDSAHFLKVVVSMRVNPDDTLQQWFRDLPNQTALMRVEVYRRIDTLQAEEGPNPCRCSLYEPFDTMTITKGMYMDLNVPSNGDDPQFRDMTFWLDMRRHDGRGWLDSSNSTRYHFRTSDVAGKWFGGATTNVTDTCDSILARLTATSKINPGSRKIDGVYESDLTYRVTTTRKTTVSLLRVRTAMHMLDVLERGSLDSYMRYDLDTLFNFSDTVVEPLRRMIRRFQVMDEPYLPTFVSYADISRRMQGVLRELDPQKRGVFSNVTGNLDGFRIFAGDLDTTSTREKPIHHILTQNYQNYFGWVPVRYANPDMMSDTALATWWPADTTYWYDTLITDRREYDSTLSDTITLYDTAIVIANTFPKRVAFQSDYATVTAGQQEIFGSVFDWQSNAAGVGFSALLVPRLVRAMQVTRNRYRSIVADSVPIWNIIQLSGYKREGQNLGVYHNIGYANNPQWDHLTPVHPEAVSAQAWLALNCGIHGIFWHDMVTQGIDFGIVDDHYGVDSANKFVEYGTLHATGQWAYDLNPEAWTLPRMWVGMRSRFAMVKRIGWYFRDTILPVYEQLVRPGAQISVHDTRMSFREIPVVDTLVTQLPQRYAFDSTGGYVDSSAIDPRSSTFMELTVYDPKPWGQLGGASLGAERGAKYLLLTNRRTFPDDTLHYGATAQGNGANSIGLGRVDARRPLIRLKNSTSMLTDSFVISKVGETGWQRRVRIDSLVALDWLEPGWGAMYKVEPIPSGVTRQATAWNNAVRAENTARDTGTGTRLLVYERDSAIWMRAVTTSSLTTAIPVWSAEWLVSDATDTAVAGPGRVAHCMYPTIATTRNGQSALVVWERRNQSGVHTIEALRYDSIPTTAAAMLTSNRYTLSASVPLPDSLNQTPAVVGLRGGYLVSWAQPSINAANTGVAVMAIKDTISGFNVLTNQDAVTITGLHSSFIVDSVTRYPTLAAIPRTQRFYSSEAVHWSTMFPPFDTLSVGFPLPATIQTTKLLQAVHLAYQQGTLNEKARQKIVYHSIGVSFPTNDPPVLTVMKAEDVNADRPFCLYLHPSISCDSARIGVAYETVEHSHVVTLRFRSGGFDQYGIWSVDTTKGPWQTRLYEWGEWRAVMKPRTFLPVIYQAKNYTRPSLVHFPARDSFQMANVASQGMLAWQWENDSTGRHNRQYLYRYGQRRPDDLLDGHDPSMLIAPYVNGIPGGVRAQSGVFHRGADSTRVLRVRPNGDSVWGYPLALENTPLVPIALFNVTSGRGVVSLASFTGPNPFVTSTLCGVAQKWRLDIAIHDRHDGSPNVPPAGKPGIADDALSPGGAPSVPVTSVAEAANVLRTATFTVGSDPVTFERAIVVGDSVIGSWLDSQPYDTTLLRPADIGVVTELVRDSDGVVLWRGDTLWTRVLGDSALVEEVEVPAHLWAPSGTEAYVRLNIVTTDSLEVIPTAEILVAENLPELTVTPKRVLMQQMAASPGRSEVQVVVHPNPLKNREGELVVRVREPGWTVIEVVDAMGRQVMAPFSAELVVGEHRLVLDVHTLAAGTYTVLVRQGTEQSSAQVIVAR